MNRRKNLRLLRQAFRIAGTDKVLSAYVGLFIIAALLIWRLEPAVTRLSDGLWYCFAVATTIGFGDYAAETGLGRIISVILSIYSTGVVAILTAVLTSYFLDLAKAKASDSAKEFLDELERLPELSEDELRSLSERVKLFVRGKS